MRAVGPLWSKNHPSRGAGGVKRFNFARQMNRAQVQAHQASIAAAGSLMFTRKVAESQSLTALTLQQVVDRTRQSFDQRVRALDLTL